MRFTQVMTNVERYMALNAGVIATDFDPSEGTLDASDILCATTGGTTFTATPTYTDFGSDVDNCPKNLKGMKRLESWEAKLSATGITYSADQLKILMGAADKETDSSTKVSTLTPRDHLSTALNDDDFKTLWYICDYTDVNTDGSTELAAGFIAIKLNNALNTKGFELKTTDKGKGQSSFEFLCHYDQDATTGALTDPFAIYIFDTRTNEKPEDEE